MFVCVLVAIFFQEKKKKKKKKKKKGDGGRGRAGLLSDVRPRASVGGREDAVGEQVDGRRRLRTRSGRAGVRRRRSAAACGRRRAGGRGQRRRACVGPVAAPPAIA